MSASIAILLALLFLLAPAQAQQQTKPVLKLAANYWEPYTGPNIPGQGAATEIVVTAFAHAGYPVQVQFMPWSRVLAMAYAGQVDGIVGIWFTTQRSTRLLYSESYLVNELNFYRGPAGRCDDPSPNESPPPRVGVGRDYDYSDTFLAKYGTWLAPGDRILYNLLKLKAGRIDMLLEDKYTLHFAMSEHAKALGPIQIMPCSVTPQMKLPLHFSINANFPHAQQVISDFNAEIRKMKQNGEIGAILNRLATLGR